MSAWRNVVFGKVNLLPLKMKGALSTIHKRRNAAATKIQTMVRGYIVRRQRSGERQEFDFLKLRITLRVQALYRGWKARTRVKLLKALASTSNTVKRLFEARRIFQNFDKDGAYLCLESPCFLLSNRGRNDPFQ
jgi:hypothetical protein